MIEAPAADAPYAGPWVPLYNSPIWADPSFFGLPGDPVGSLSRFVGKSTKGTWTTLAADQAAFDTGTAQCVVDHRHSRSFRVFHVHVRGQCLRHEDGLRHFPMSVQQSLIPSR